MNCKRLGQNIAAAIISATEFPNKNNKDFMLMLKEYPSSESLCGQ